MLWVLAAGAGSARAAASVPTDFVDETIVPGLNEPNSLSFLPDGRIMFTEQRNGKVRMVVNGHIASTDPLLAVPSLNASGYERGLQGIAIDPQWPTRPYVYLFYTRNGGALRLVRYTASGDVSDPLGENITLGTPLLLIDDIPDGNPNHNAGCLRFAPDGMLFVSLGEDDGPCAAYDSTLLKGQVLRLKVDALPPGGGGQVLRADLTPPDNPLSTPDSNAKLVWAYGMRNPWRYQIDPVTGHLYLADVGEADFEELNEVEAGDYLGWPYREGNLIMVRPGCPEPGGSGSSAYRPPIVIMPHNNLTAIISAGPYRPVGGAPSNWPSPYDGSVFYGEYFSGVLRRIVQPAGAWVPADPVPGQPNSIDWATGLGSEVDFQVGPDGSLWYLRQFDDTFAGVTGSLGRIRYVGLPAGSPPPPALRSGLFGAPNPFAASSRVGFRLTAPQRVRLDIYDIGGRRLRRLFEGVAPAGESVEPWDGRDADGRGVPPGLYLVRLERPGAVETLRLLRLR